MKIALCYEPPAEGACEDLQDVEAQAVFLNKYLRKIGCRVRRVPYRGRVQAFLFRLKGVDLAWNLFETFGGREDRQYMGASLLELAGVKYTGSSLPALVLSEDKRVVKTFLKGGGVPAPESYTPGHFTAGRWMVKPSKMHGSVGITDESVVDAASEDGLAQAIASFPPEWEVFAEHYIDGEEYSASLLDRGEGLKTICVARMHFADYPLARPRILGFASKWQEDSPDYRSTVRAFDVDLRVAKQAAAIADKAAAVMGLRGFARVDLRMDREGRLWVIDVNPNPGLGEDAGFIAACRHQGVEAEAALKYILSAAAK